MSTALNGKLDSVLERVLHHMPSDAERVELYKWVNAFGIHHNDALLMLVAIGQRNSWALSQHPDRMEAAVRKVIAETAKSAEGVADKAISAEMDKVRPAISKAVTEAVAAGAKAVAAQQQRVSQIVVALWGAAIAAVFGGLFMVCGWELARGQLPFWMKRDVAESGGGLARVLGAVLGAPSGPWVAVCALAALGLTFRHRWERLKMSVHDKAERRKAYAFFAASAVGWVGFAVCVFVLVGRPGR